MEQSNLRKIVAFSAIDPSKPIRLVAPFEAYSVVDMEAAGASYLAIGVPGADVVLVLSSDLDQYQYPKGNIWSFYLLVTWPDGRSELWEMFLQDTTGLRAFSPVTDQEFAEMPAEFQQEARALGYQTKEEQEPPCRG